MKLLFVTPWLAYGGAERQTITLANRLAERGHDCELAYIKDEPSQLERLSSTVPASCLGGTRYLDVPALKRLTQKIRDGKPSRIVAMNQYGLFYAWMAKRLATSHAPLTVTFHTTVLMTLKEKIQLAYYKPLFRSSECLVYVCEGQKRYWVQRGLRGRRTEVIYNGVDLEHWKPVSEEARRCIRSALDYAPSDFVIGLSAVLRPEKNHVQLVDAVAALRSRGVPARALLIGDGPMRAAVEARARGHGIAEHVMITGFQEDVRVLVGAADAMVLCSTAVETFSMAALEAMALARPVVQSELGGAAEMTVPGENGYLFPVGDTRALIERLAALADERERRRMGRAARASVERHFSERAMVDGYEIMFQELETERNRRGNLQRPAGAH
ncbi:MAG TPA: glycosyltransferase [Burkholderiales bacterium]